MTPADIRYAVQWQRQHDFTMEFLYNGGGSVTFRGQRGRPAAGGDQAGGQGLLLGQPHLQPRLPGLQAGLQGGAVEVRDVRRAARLGGGPSLINSQIEGNFTWAAKNGIPAEPARGGHRRVLGPADAAPAAGGQSLPGRGDGPRRHQVDRHGRLTRAEHAPGRRGARRPPAPDRGRVRRGHVAEEVSEFNWFNTSKADGGSGLCQRSKVTACITPLSPRPGGPRTSCPARSRSCSTRCWTTTRGRSSCTSPTWPATGWATT